MYHIFVKNYGVMTLSKLICSQTRLNDTKINESAWHNHEISLLNYVYFQLWQILSRAMQLFVWSNSKVIASTVNNVWEPLLLVVLLGCIIKESSRFVWNAFKNIVVFNNNHFQETKAVSGVVKQDHLLNPYIKTFHKVVKNKTNMSCHFLSDKLTEVPSKKRHIHFHQQIIKILHTCYHTEMQYERLIDVILTSQNLYQQIRNNHFNQYTLLNNHSVRLQEIHDNGREFWPFIESCSCSELQSPINISRQRVTYRHFAPLSFTDTYDEHRRAYLTNANQTAAVVLDGRPPFLEGGPLRGSYKFAQLHFHWSIDDTSGSEHTLDERPFSMECHSVYIHFSCETISEALECENGIAVVGNFLQACDFENRDFLPISDNLRNIRKYDSVYEISSNCFSWLNSNDPFGYYTYPGSLTTPLLSKTVTWILYPDPISISSSQICGFRDLLDNKSQLIRKNCRNVQNLNNRDIFYAV